MVISGRYLAVHRPQKGTYFVMRLSQTTRRWTNCSAMHAGVTFELHTSPLAEQNGQSTNISLNPANTQLIGLVSSGQYLKSVGQPNTLRIPVFKKVRGLLSNINSQGEDVTAPSVAVSENYTTPLFTFRNDPPAAPPAPVNLNINIRNQINNNGHQPVQYAPPKPIPRRIAWLIAEDACRNNEECSITMEAITPITAKVTSCFHVFDGAAIDTWLQTHNTCPVCKQACVTTAAWVDEAPPRQQQAPQDEQMEVV